MRDDELLDRLQGGAFGYFVDATNPDNGLVADSSRDGSPASIAVVGFGLSVLAGLDLHALARVNQPYRTQSQAIKMAALAGVEHLQRSSSALRGSGRSPTSARR
jgi:hypothetical protein